MGQVRHLRQIVEQFLLGGVNGGPGLIVTHDVQLPFGVDDELTASPGMRARIATAAMTLEAVADRYAEVEPSSTE